MKAVVFDLFETLVTEWGRFKYTKALIAQDLGIDAVAFKKSTDRLHNDCYTGKLKNTEEMLWRALEDMGIPADQALVREVGRRRDENKASVLRTIEPEILELLHTLKRRGFLLGLVSNCSPEEITGFSQSPLAKIIDVPVFSCVEGLVKPDPAIFMACLTRLSIDAAQALYVGDDAGRELPGAQAVGMTSLRAAWFAKRFMDGFERDKTFPLLYEPGNVMEFLDK